MLRAKLKRVTLVRILLAQVRHREIFIRILNRMFNSRAWPYRMFEVITTVDRGVWPYLIIIVQNRRIPEHDGFRYLNDGTDGKSVWIFKEENHFKDSPLRELQCWCTKQGLCCSWNVGTITQRPFLGYYTGQSPFDFIQSKWKL